MGTGGQSPHSGLPAPKPHPCLIFHNTLWGGSLLPVKVFGSPLIIKMIFSFGNRSCFCPPLVQLQQPAQQTPSPKTHGRVCCNHCGSRNACLLLTCQKWEPCVIGGSAETGTRPNIWVFIIISHFITFVSVLFGSGLQNGVRCAGEMAVALTVNTWDQSIDWEPMADLLLCFA